MFFGSGQGVRTMKYKKSQFGERFCKTTRNFFTRTQHTRPPVPASGPPALRAPTRTAPASAAHPPAPRPASTATRPRRRLPHVSPANSTTTTPPPTPPTAPPPPSNKSSSPSPPTQEPPTPATPLHDAARRRHRAELGSEVAEKKKATVAALPSTPPRLPPRCWPPAAAAVPEPDAGSRRSPSSISPFSLSHPWIRPPSLCRPPASPPWATEGQLPHDGRPLHYPHHGTTCCGAPPPPSSLAPWSLSFSIDGRGHILCSKGSRKNNYQEYVQLKSTVEILQHSQRNLLGEDLAPLSTSELEQLESQVDKTLKQIIRSRKVLLDELCDLKRKEQMLQDDNRVLKRKLDEVDAEAVAPPPQLLWQGGSSSGDTMLSDGPPQLEHFFQALESNPLSLQPTFHTMDMNQQPAPGSCYLPAWMA